jgi:TolB-like protein
VAIFPVENLSGEVIPADGIRQVLGDRLTQAGVRVLGTDDLEAFLKRHRVRYAAGLDTQTAGLLRQETGVDGAVIVSVGLSSETYPPKAAMLARLVSVEGPPAVAWSDDVAMAGDDAPGWFDLGLVDDYQVLLTRGLDRLATSLVSHFDTGRPEAGSGRAGKFRPRMFFRAETLEAGRAASVAVVPFHNASLRRNAGEIVSLLFVRHLASLSQWRPVEPGVVRRELLAARIIMDAGPSITDAETVAALLEADFVLGGRVLAYSDFEGSGGIPRVDFSAVLIDRKTRRVVWSSESYNDGSDGVRFFDRGRSRTAHVMATQMVRHVTEMMAGDRP